MKTLIITVIFLLFLASFLPAQVPQTLSYQGILTDTEGKAIPDGAYQLTFKLYDASENGTALWTEVQSVTITNGLFDAILGSVTALNLPFDQKYWLSIAIGTNPELIPRIELTASAYSLNSRTVMDSTITAEKISIGTVVRQINSLTDNVTVAAGQNISVTTSDDSLIISAAGGNGGDITAVNAGEGLTGGGVAGDVILDIAAGPGLAVSADALSLNTAFTDPLYVNENQLNAVSNTMIQDNAVTAVKIADNQIADADISTAANIAQSKISNAVRSIDADMVDGKHAADFLSSTSDYGRSGVTTDLYEGTTKLIDKYINEGQSDAISTDMIQNNALTSAKIDTGQVVKSINSLKDDVTLAAGNNVTITPSGNTITISATGTGAANTLDMAYDQGGPGAGRSITADAGAVNIAGPNGLTVNGNVGIGTTNPSARLHLAGGNLYLENDLNLSWRNAAGTNYLRLVELNDNDKILIGNTAAKGGTAIESGNDIWFASGANTLLHLENSNGNVGIGTITPSQKLDVAGTAQMTGFKMPTGAIDGYVLTSDATGIGIWKSSAAGMGGTGTASYISKFTATNSIGNSAIYDNNGKIGIGNITPKSMLDVRGIILGHGSSANIQGVDANSPSAIVGITGLSVGGFSGDGALQGVMSSTNADYAAVGGSAYNNALGLYLRQNGSGKLVKMVSGGTEQFTVLNNGFVGLGVTNPASRLDVNGIIQLTGFKLPTGATAGYVLTSDASGVGTWQVASGGGGGMGGSGTANYLSKFTGTSTLGNSIIYELNNKIGIGTTSPSEKFEIAGSTDPLFKINTTFSGTWIHPLRILAPNMVNWNNVGMQFGRTNTTKNFGYLGFTYFGDGSNNNFASIGLGGVDNILSVVAKKAVGINITDPLAALDVRQAGATGLLIRADGTAFNLLRIEDAAAHLRWRVDQNYAQFLTNAAGTDIMGLEQTKAWFNQGNLGVGTTNPAQKLDVAGTAQMTGFKLPTGATAGYVLTSDASGVGTWQVASGGGGGMGGSGTVNYIPKFTAGTVLANSTIYETGGKVGIGTTTPGTKLTVTGSSDSLVNITTTFSGTWIHPLRLFGPNADGWHNIGMRFGKNESTRNFGYLGFTYLGNGSSDSFVALGLGGVDNVLNVTGQGRVGIGTTVPTEMLQVAGTVYSTSGGFKFPDGTIQATAAAGGGLILPYNGPVSNSSDAFSITNTGTGRAGYFKSNNLLTINPALEAEGRGFAGAIYGKSLGAGTAVTGYATGSGMPGLFKIDNTANTMNALQVSTNGTGNGIYATNASAGSSSIAAVWGESTGANGYGVVGIANTGTTAVAIRGVSSEGWAGYFWGSAKVTGNLSVTGTISKGGGSFKIDHPLDPQNKYLYHSFIESPDMMNIYNGNVVLDANGEAWVELPRYFESLNRDFRYQLTCIGGQALVYVAEEIRNNRFKIAGGTPALKVSWQVTGIRKDAFAESHRIIPEVDKEPENRGKYLHARELGRQQELSIGWEKETRETEQDMK